MLERGRSDDRIRHRERDGSPKAARPLCDGPFDRDLAVWGQQSLDRDLIAFVSRE
jgi:hypothetical protein